jgi:D-alanyl-D-alanine carboxypeptidase (penicillin-binding protein 5/6)
MKRWICLLLAALLLLTPAMALEQPTDEELKISAPSAILMERSTGTVLYEKNADEHLSPASVTKIMTLLLIMEQLDSGQLDRDRQCPSQLHGRQPDLAQRGRADERRRDAQVHRRQLRQ